MSDHPDVACAHAEACLCQRVAQQKRRPGMQVMIDVPGIVSLLRPPVIGGNAQDEDSALLQFSPDLTKGFDRKGNVLEGMIRDGDVGDPIHNGIKGRMALYAIPGGLRSGGWVNLHTDSPGTVQGFQEVAATAAEIENTIIGLHMPFKLHGDERTVQLRDRPLVGEIFSP
jgi:hypothetical protein